MELEDRGEFSAGPGQHHVRPDQLAFAPRDRSTWPLASTTNARKSEAHTREGDGRSAGTCEVMKREDARWALGLVVGLGLTLYAGIMTWKQALGLVGYFGAYVVAMLVGIVLILVSMGLTAVSAELFEWFCKRFPVLGRGAGRLFYWVVSTLILVFAAGLAWHVASEMVASAWTHPVTLLVGLLLVFSFPLVYGLVVLVRAIWRRYRAGEPTGVRAPGHREGDVVDAEFEDLGGPPRSWVGRWSSHAWAQGLSLTTHSTCRPGSRSLAWPQVNASVRPRSTT